MLLHVEPGIPEGLCTLGLTATSWLSSKQTSQRASRIHSCRCTHMELAPGDLFCGSSSHGVSWEDLSDAHTQGCPGESRRGKHHGSCDQRAPSERNTKKSLLGVFLPLDPRLPLQLFTRGGRVPGQFLSFCTDKWAGSALGCIT